MEPRFDFNLCAAPGYCISCHSCQNVFMPGSCCVIQSGDWNDVFMHELYYVSSHKVGHVRAALFVSVDNKRCAACMFPADFEVSAATLHLPVGWLGLGSPVMPHTASPVVVPDTQIVLRL